MIKYVCKVCKKEFWHYKSRKRKYCSIKCRNTPTKEKREKHRKLMNKLWQNPEFKKHMSEVHKGYKMPEEQKRKIGLKSKQWRATEETKKKMSFVKIGSKNPMWKNGQMTDKKGYILIKKRNHPFCKKSGYILRSHLAMEKKIKRYLKPEERVHHKGIHFPLGSVKNKQDDSPENLQLFANESKHQKFHKPKGSMIGRNKIIHI